MNIKDLILFIERNSIEWHWFAENINKDRDTVKDVVIFVNDYQLEDFRKVLTSYDYDDEGLEVVMKDNYFCIKMNDLCDNNDIDLCDVFNINENAELIRGL